MPAIDVLLAFALATLVFGYMPGPGMLYATAQTLARGQRAGLMAALGLHIGGYAHVFAAALGLALLFDLVPVLYTTLKLAGAVYLVWLGVQLFRTPAAPNGQEPDIQTSGRAFRQSVLVEVLNPKTALFYVAFLPQFTDAAAALPIWAQLLVLGAVVNLVFSSADILCVLLAGRVRLMLARSAGTANVLRRAGGCILFGLAFYLAVSRA